jgi:flagellar biosynthesis chaperone FliJ
MPDIYQLPPYPLEQVLEVKKKRVEDAEAVVKQKIRELDDEREKLKKREEERDKVKEHYNEKLQQLRDEFDQGTTSNKIDQIKVYIKVVQERLKSEEKKVKDQQQAVEVAEKNLELAKTHLKARQREQDKIETHKKEWTRDARIELSVLQTREEDEIGSTMFLSKYTQKRSEKE